MEISDWSLELLKITFFFIHSLNQLIKTICVHKYKHDAMALQTLFKSKIFLTKQRNKQKL